MDIFSILFNMKVCSVFLLESPHRGGSNEYIQHTIFSIKKVHILNYPKSVAMGICSKRLKNEFETAVVDEPSEFEPLEFYCSNINALYEVENKLQTDGLLRISS